MAFRNIRANLLRAMLTLSIIAFGIMALVGILTAIDVIANSLNDSFSGLGANSFSIDRKWSTVRGSRGGIRQKESDPIRFEQAMRFKERFDFPASVSISLQATSLATVKYGNKKSNPNITLIGADENYFAAKGLDVAVGRNFSRTEVEAGHQKIILGSELVKILFDNQPERALDQIVLVGSHRYRVVGVLRSKGAAMNSQADRAVYAPLVNVRALYGTSETNYDLVVSVNHAPDLEEAKSEAIGLFRQIRGLRPGQEDDFEVFASDSLIAIFKENTTNLRLATIAIGLMTLLGAAIGLMNIMLVSVTERTREIGIYKALGSTRRNILYQFLAEAVLICQLGGAVGIALGILVGNVITLLLGGTFLVPWPWILLGFFLCMLVGVASGFYPALKASRLDPIEALRYE